MIRGYFSSAKHRPFVQAIIRFPGLGNRRLTVEMLIDTGADRTVLAPSDVLRLGVDLNVLPAGALSTGIGGQMATRSIDAVLTLETFSTTLPLTVLAPPSTPLPIPSLLGRDVLAHLALFFDPRTQRVLLLEPHEVDRLNLP